MSELKTKQTNVSVDKFLKSVDEKRRADCYKLVYMMKMITKTEPKMWGPSIIGFGSYHYKYASGHEGEMCVAGFSPRKQALTVYVFAGFSRYNELLKELGKFKKSAACLYIKKLEDVDLKVLNEIIKESVKYVKNKKWE